ncbi:helix-turn-helix domain-containing protein [Streptomyces sp. NPDC101455]|uniref:AraC family transcriptional regulator n=1 Tax=Streptomyces sp. NPDC101455 TaxID=3366142 RepID=UPI003819296D
METLPPEHVLPRLSTPIVSRQVVHEQDLPAHAHSFMELAIVREGTATHVSAAGPQPIERGAMVLLRPGEWHGYEDCDNLVIHDVYIGLDLFARELAWIAEDPTLGILLKPPHSGRIALVSGQARLGPDALARLEVWCGVLAAADRKAAQDRATRIGHAVLILGEVAAAVAPVTNGGYLPATTHRSVLRAVRLMEDELAAPWTLESLAREVNLAPAYLVRLFTKHLGIPPIAYLNRIRAERAGVLLIETDLSVAAIGAQVGWTDPTYVSRRFKACFAMAPARYRSAFRAKLERL